MSITLAAPFALLTASRYARPADPAAVLPDVYGDFSAGGLRGPIPAIMVDTTNFIYIAAAHPVQSIDNVYIDDIEQTSGFTVNVSYNLESLGNVAVIDFTSQPNGTVTWRGKGKRDGVPALITDPIDQIKDLLKTRAGFVDADFCSGCLADAKTLVAAAGYLPAWVIADREQIATWLTEMLFNVEGHWRLSGDQVLHLLVDSSSASFLQLIETHFIASRDCVNGDDGVELFADLQHLCNALTILYQWSWSEGAPSTLRTDLTDAVSLNIHGEIRKIVTLRGLRTAAELSTWATLAFNRQSFRTRLEGARLQFTAVGAKAANLAPGDIVTLTWNWGPLREEGNGYINEMLRLLTTRHSVDRGGRTEITAQDLGLYRTIDLYFDALVDFDASIRFGGGRLLTAAG